MGTGRTCIAGRDFSPRGNSDRDQSPDCGENSEQATKIAHYYYENINPTTRAEFQAVKEKIASQTKARTDFENTIPATLIMEDMSEPREAFVLKRGEYDKPGEKVERGVPAVFPPLPEGTPVNRLGLAKWLVDPANPLTSV
ncbi:MAG: hypothetical protein R3C11_01960 [Planctomycetaceae bacterium]